MMRIGIDGRSLQDKPWSGVGQYTYNLLHALFELDKQNEYIIWYNAAGKLEVPLFEEFKNVRVMRTHWPNKVLNLLMKFVPYVTGYILHVTCDIFFLPNLNFITLSKQAKLVLTVHDLSFEHFPEHFSLKTRLWHKAINPRALAQRVSRIIAVSKHTQEDLIETYGLSKEKVCVVYLGVKTNTLSVQANSVRASQSYILYFGALEPRKNIGGVIAAYEKLKPREKLVIAGRTTSYGRYLKRRIKQSKARDNIQLIENPSEDQKAKLYTTARIFVYPSFYEGFGFPPLEAMSVGVPVVASSASAVPEICGNAALFVSPWKIEEIKEGMRVMLEEEETRKKYVELGFARAKEFSWQNTATRLMEIFKSV